MTVTAVRRWIKHLGLSAVSLLLALGTAVSLLGRRRVVA